MSKHRYALPYAAPHVAYAHAPFVYNALDTGLVYPVAEAYVHDATGELKCGQQTRLGKKAKKTKDTRRYIAIVLKTTPQLLTIIMTMMKKILIMVTR